jgi:hypothetical protein
MGKKLFVLFVFAYITKIGWQALTINKIIVKDWRKSNYKLLKLIKVISAKEELKRNNIFLY